MSDLQCPTRVFVARHGEAEYETDLVTDDGGSLTALGRRQARELGESLRGERIARVWTSSLSRAVQTAEIAAAVLGVDVVVREGLREYGVGDLAGAVARVSRVLDEAADQHRGEAVLAVSHGGAILATVPQLVGLPRTHGLGVTLPSGVPLALEVDAEGWRLAQPGWLSPAG